MDTYEGLVRKECAYIMPISCEAKVQRPGGIIQPVSGEWGSLPLYVKVSTKAV